MSLYEISFEEKLILRPDIIVLKGKESEQKVYPGEIIEYFPCPVSLEGFSVGDMRLLLAKNFQSIIPYFAPIALDYAKLLQELENEDMNITVLPTMIFRSGSFFENIFEWRLRIVGLNSQGSELIVTPGKFDFGNEMFSFSTEFFLCEIIQQFVKWDYLLLKKREIDSII